ncbi:glycerol kinase GlpK [Lichenicola cladoniae]|uniref:Glycerol kinase n=1 Tax=Lichenicola cladoniae TaxID=1484109 RepID=A0A6M8HNM2_9PROT|nr:glycerol kinase GlpK [Lichenicola cladoniae]NPD67403.1 glycerol kinase GlpK [Acetobacteraceae bacterium]QKE89895.1 glycerol kinase GlpK [Lichenicola cladoniae]
MTASHPAHAHVLVIDQGTTSTRAIVFDHHMHPVAQAQEEFPQIYAQPGWVEHNPETLWATVLGTARAALQKAGLAASDIAALGIANQRETTLIWERSSGRPIHNAIVWQDRRTASICDRLERDGHAELIAERTGLRIDPYFSGTKISWMLDQVPGARARAERGELAFGTVDSFLIWRLTGGRVHAIDATNASRTLLCDIRSGTWDPDLVRLLDIPVSLLPEIRDSAGSFGETLPELLGGAIAIRGVAGDQQAALIGQCCFSPGTIKATYGTGGFILLNTGTELKRSKHRLLSTIAWQRNGVRHYALEGSIFSAGAAVQWLRDGLGLVESSAETGRLAEAADPAQTLYLVPAFTGLGAPHWDSRAQALITGITRGTTKKELARATLESVGFQTRDLLAAMLADDDEPDRTRSVFRVDGGMSASNWTMQFLADTLDMPIDRPAFRETTAMGAGYLAGLDAGVYPEPEIFERQWKLDRRFMPNAVPEDRDRRYRGWQRAVKLALTPQDE